MRTAAIGIGSNSLRMLLAEIEQGRMKRLKRYREGLRTFAALNELGEITPEMTELASQKVGAFAREARGQGAESVFIFATSAVRDAKNQENFLRAVAKEAGVDVEVCTGETEARLSYIGATGPEPSGLIDIGGGSTEIAVGEGNDVQQAVSLQLGAVRLFRQQPITDDATARKALEIAKRTIEPVRERFSARKNWVGVGGTFTLAAALAQNLPWSEREKIHHYRLEAEKVRELLFQLAPLTLEERLRMPSMQPGRADIAAHGLTILLACMELLQISSIQASEYGNLEGYLKLKYACR